MTIETINQLTLKPSNHLGHDINPTVVTWSWQVNTMLTTEPKTYHTEYTVTNSLDLECIIEALNSPRNRTAVVSVVEVTA